jgi:hypothetical protein
LLYNTPRQATVIACPNGAALWSLDRATFREATLEANIARASRHAAFVDGVALLAGLDATARAAVGDCLVAETFKRGECLLRQGEVGEVADRLFILEVRPRAQRLPPHLKHASSSHPRPYSHAPPASPSAASSATPSATRTSARAIACVPPAAAGGRV